MIEAAQKAKAIDPFLRRKAERIQRKKGGGVATVAVAHHLLIIVYHLLKEKREYYPGKLRKNLWGRPVGNLVVSRTDR
jgi:malate/lactate dehydrogenase